MNPRLDAYLGSPMGTIVLDLLCEPVCKFKQDIEKELVKREGAKGVRMSTLFLLRARKDLALAANSPD
jgi:hypothetical protein